MTEDKAPYALLNGKEYSLYPLEKEGWKPIGDSTGNANAAFVDGGNACIVKAPAAELHRVRTAVAITRGKRLVKVEKQEGFVLATAEIADGRESYTARILPEPGKEASSTLRFGAGEITSQTPLTKAAEATRKTMEIAAALQALKHLKGGFLLLDGTLEALTGKEKECVTNLALAAAGNGVVHGSVAKTCSILASNGDSLIGAADSVSGGEAGYILVAERRHREAVAIARLNRSSQHLFRIEAPTHEHLKKLLPELKAQSNDLAFPGYPYGLIMADRFARVSNNEADITRAKIRATADAGMKKLLKQEKALDAHGILDGM
ncbi:TPA: DNA double-strand break repair nuclease NurA [Candidatus Woesearchaeota archaeon]|nr:DNA double-strand break repair nuclease NurA [Candidatus Woesearchaeota archaeon]